MLSTEQMMLAVAKAGMTPVSEASVLALSQSPKTIARVARLLQLARPAERERMLYGLGALGAVGEPLIKPIIEVASADPNLVRPAATALAGMAPSWLAMEAIVTISTKHDDSSGLYWLPRFGQAAVAPLRRIMDQNGSLASAACQILKPLVVRYPLHLHHMLPYLESERVDFRATFCAAVGVLGSEAAPAIDTLIGLVRDDVAVRVPAARALAAIGPPANTALKDVLRDLLESDNAFEADGVAHWMELLRILGRIDAAEATRALLRAVRLERIEPDTSELWPDPPAFDVIDLLVEALQDPATRLTACVWLRHCGPAADAAVPALLEVATADGPDGVAAKLALCAIVVNADARVAGLLGAMLADESFDDAVSQMLERTPSVDASLIDTLIPGLMRSPHRMHCARLLAAHIETDERVLLAYRNAWPSAGYELLNDLADHAGFAAINFGDELVALLEKDGMPSARCCTLLLAGGEAGHQLLVRAMMAGATSAATALGSAGMLAPLKEALASVDPKAKRAGLIGVNELANTDLAAAASAVPAMLEWLETETSAYRWDLLEVLSKFDAPEAASALMPLLQSDDSRLVPYALQATLACRSQPEKVVPAVAALLDHSSSDVRQMALWVLGQFGQASAAHLPAVVAAMHQESRRAGNRSATRNRAMAVVTVMQLAGDAALDAGFRALERLLVEDDADLSWLLGLLNRRWPHRANAFGARFRADQPREPDLRRRHRERGGHGRSDVGNVTILAAHCVIGRVGRIASDARCAPVRRQDGFVILPGAALSVGLDEPRHG